jgi:hypothetical protein
MIELAIESGRPLDELYALELEELATFVDVLAERGGRHG